MSLWNGLFKPIRRIATKLFSRKCELCGGEIGTNPDCKRCVEFLEDNQTYTA